VHAEVPRVQCKEHGCQTIEVPWAQGNSRYSLLFEAMVIMLLKETSIASLSCMLNMSWNSVDGMMQRAVSRGLSRREPPSLRDLGIDEVSCQKRHAYVTVVSNEQGEVIHVGNDRSGESLARFYKTLTDDQKADICGFSMDMWPAYIRATLDHAPNAQQKIAFDKFHVNQHLNEAVNAVRKQEHRALMKAGDETLKGAKHNWLCNYADLERSLQRELEQMRYVAKKTGRAWSIKEYTKGLWPYVRHGWAEKAWQRWYQ